MADPFLADPLYKELFAGPLEPDLSMPDPRDERAGRESQPRDGDASHPLANAFRLAPPSRRLLEEVTALARKCQAERRVDDAVAVLDVALLLRQFAR